TLVSGWRQRDTRRRMSHSAPARPSRQGPWMNALRRRTGHEAMVRLAEGDRGAFDAVFAGLWPELLAFVRSAMPGHPDAEDLAQQTLLKIFFRISELDTTRDGVAWAFGIAIFEVRTLRRK